jgi:hypothetical protein
MSVQIHETPAPTEADARQARETLGRKRGRDSYWRTKLSASRFHSPKVRRGDHSR